MSKKQDENKRQDTVRAKLIIQSVCIVALVFVVGIDAFSIQFETNPLVYAIIGGVALGVGGKQVAKEIARRIIGDGK